MADNSHDAVFGSILDGAAYRSSTLAEMQALRRVSAMPKHLRGTTGLVPIKKLLAPPPERTPAPAAAPDTSRAGAVASRGYRPEPEQAPGATGGGGRDDLPGTPDANDRSALGSRYTPERAAESAAAMDANLARRDSAIEGAGNVIEGAIAWNEEQNADPLRTPASPLGPERPTMDTETTPARQAFGQGAARTLIGLPQDVEVGFAEGIIGIGELLGIERPAGEVVPSFGAQRSGTGGGALAQGLTTYAVGAIPTLRGARALAAGAAIVMPKVAKIVAAARAAAGGTWAGRTFGWTAKNAAQGGVANIGGEAGFGRDPGVIDMLREVGLISKSASDSEAAQLWNAALDFASIEGGESPRQAYLQRLKQDALLGIPLMGASALIEFFVRLGRAKTALGIVQEADSAERQGRALLGEAPLGAGDDGSYGGGGAGAGADAGPGGPGAGGGPGVSGGFDVAAARMPPLEPEDFSPGSKADSETRDQGFTYLATSVSLNRGSFQDYMTLLTERYGTGGYKGGRYVNYWVNGLAKANEIRTRLDYEALFGTKQIPGAPPRTTAAELPELRERMLDMAREGLYGKEFYETAGDLTLGLANGDLELAKTYARVQGIYGRRTGIKENLQYFLRAVARHKAGLPVVDEKLPGQAQAAQWALDGDPRAYDWLGKKIEPYFYNLMARLDATAPQAPAVDRHMKTAWHGDYRIDKATGETLIDPETGEPIKTAETVTDAQNAFIQGEIALIGKQLGIPPQQAQAAVWMTEYARKHGLDLDEMQAANFGALAEGEAGYISVETMPHKDTGILPELADAPWPLQQAYHSDIFAVTHDKDGKDLLAEALKLSSLGTLPKTVGVFSDENAVVQFSPGAQTRAIMPEEGTEPSGKIMQQAAEEATAYAIAEGLLYRQKAVPFHRLFPEGSKAKSAAMQIDVGRIMNRAEMKRLHKAVARVFGHGKFAPVATEKGANVVNWFEGDEGEPTTKEFYDGVESIIDKVFPGEEAVTLRRMRADHFYLENDWRLNPNGEDYLRNTLTGRPDLLEGVGKVVARFLPAIDAVNRRWAKRHGWTLPERGAADADRASLLEAVEGPGAAIDRNIRPGGRVVAIIAPGPFSQERALARRSELAQVYGVDPERFALMKRKTNGTGPEVRVIVLQPNTPAVTQAQRDTITRRVRELGGRSIGQQAQLFPEPVVAGKQGGLDADDPSAPDVPVPLSRAVDAAHVLTSYLDIEPGPSINDMAGTRHQGLQVAGFYRANQRYMGVALGNDTPGATFTHELGHALAYALGLSNDVGLPNDEWGAAKQMGLTEPMIREMIKLSQLRRPHLWSDFEEGGWTALEAIWGGQEGEITVYRRGMQELFADSISTYIDRPDVAKKLAPEWAKWWRDTWNPTPGGKTIRFNALAPLGMLGGVGMGGLTLNDIVQAEPEQSDLEERGPNAPIPFGVFDTEAWANPDAGLYDQPPQGAMEGLSS